MPRKKLGELLRERGHISELDLSNALAEQQRSLGLLGEVLLQRRLVGKKDLAAALEEATSIPYVHCLSIEADPEVLKLIPRSVAVRHCILPIKIEDRKIVAVMAEPQNLLILDEISFVAGKGVSPRLGFRSEILLAIDKYYGADQDTDESAAEKPAEAKQPKVEFIATEGSQKSLEAVKEIQEELQSQMSPAVSLVSSTIAEAISKGASDIHMEPQTNGMIVRIRVDGVLRELTRVTAELQSTVVSRIKVLADLDIAERRNPQDGRLFVQAGSKKIDLRVSTLPTRRGEKVVIRLLDPDAPSLQFTDLGMSREIRETLCHALDRPQGMLLVTGPTGSGKTTTLYAALNRLRSTSVNIVTVEDPVEYMLEGINHVQVNTRAGLTFAKCLRSILRQDPNVIMVGEIRDGETAEIALKAAQTGHLLLTTMHTNDSVAAIARLIDLQIPTPLIASSLTAIVSQRLVRKLCVCRRQVPSTPEDMDRMLANGITNPDATKFVPVGCPACDHIGYRGRVGVFETLFFHELIREVIRSNGPPEALRTAAKSCGMKTMQEDAAEKVQFGLTTLEEVLRVVPFEQSSAVRCHHCGRELAEAFLYCPYCATKRNGKIDPTPVSVAKENDSI